MVAPSSSSHQPPAVLTIAGSDSGGAAGLQADLKTFAALGVYGMSAVAVVTAQSSLRVERVYSLPPDLLAAQIDAVLSDYGAAAVKTGFLGRVDLIETVAQRLAYWREGLRPRPFILIDPVLVNHRAESMFGTDVAAAYRRLLLPLADLVTPNRHEAALLSNGTWPAPGDPASYAGLGALGASSVLVTGLSDGDGLLDVLWSGGRVRRYPHARIETANLHGSGDTLSAAICAYVARGHSPDEAITQAQALTEAAIRRAADWRLGGGHGPVGV